MCYGAVLFDAPESFGLAFGEFIYSNLAALNATLDSIIISHAHLDHSENVQTVLDANPTVTHVYASHTAAETYATRSAYTYGNPRLNEILNSNPQFPTYDITDILEEEQTLVFGNQTLEIKAAPGHTEGTFCSFMKRLEVSSHKWRVVYLSSLLIRRRAFFLTRHHNIS
jgi:glyoxylase-like metal-dependent hydrolase (beta-lactamase superfamily II)